MNSNEYSIAFIGLGVMGAPMVKNIVNAGFKVTVQDINPQAAELLKDTAARIAATPASAACESNLIITMLPTSEIVREVLFGTDGALTAAPDNCLIVDMSTGSLPAMQELISDIDTTTHRFIDAPVGRSPREAVTGNLIAMVGGDSKDLQWFRPVLDCMADTIVHVGGRGSGLTLKLVNNYMAMVNHVLTGEVLAFADKAGLDTRVVVDVLSTTSAGRGQLLTNFPKKVLAGDVSPDFSMHMGIKDLNMALELSETIGADSHFGNLSRNIFKAAAQQGYGDKDCTAILHYQKQS